MSSLPDPDGDRDTGVGFHDGPELGPAPSMPLWMKVFGIAFIVLVMALVVMMASGHGPGRHMAGLGGHASPISATEGVRQS